MKSLINKIILLLLHILIIAALIIGIVHSSKCHIEWINSILSAILGLILSSIFRIIQDLSDNKYWMQTLRQLLRYNKIKKTDYIRISFAYLFRIKIGNKYLLIKNSRGTKKYQPIGGVYKFYDKEKAIMSNKLGVIDDNKIPIDASSKNDYRLRVPAKKLKKFVRQFNKTSNRENFNDLSRELKEELINTDIIDINNFKTIEYSTVGRDFSEIKYSRYFDTYELLLADIVNVKLTSTQEKDLNQLKSNHDFYFATENEIKTNGVNTEKSKIEAFIADHSFKILEINNINLEKFKNESFSIKIFD